MQRRRFLKLTGLGGAALAWAPALSAPARLLEPAPRVLHDATGDGRWVDAASHARGDGSLASRGARLSVLGLDGPTRAEWVRLELAHPSGDVVLWGHRGGAVPSTGRAATHQVAVDGSAGITLLVFVDGIRRAVSLRADGAAGPKLRPGSYLISSSRGTRLRLRLEETRA